MSGGEVFAYVRHKPEETILYQLMERHWPGFQLRLSEAGSFLPRHVTREFDENLECGRLEHDFLRVRCQDYHHEHLVAFSFKRRGCCPSCWAKRMAETAALFADDVLPHKPIRQSVLSFPYPLRFLLASNPQVVTKVLGIVNRVISTHLIKKTGFKKATAHTGAVTLYSDLDQRSFTTCTSMLCLLTVFTSKKTMASCGFTALTPRLLMS
jgi:hypothetical protein